MRIADLALKTGIARKSPADGEAWRCRNQSAWPSDSSSVAGRYLAGQIGIRGSMQPKLDPAETPRDKLLLLRATIRTAISASR